MKFAERYGPWVVIAGASEGTGAEFARGVAARGLSPLLIARREGPLATLAGEIRERYGVDCVTACVDLTAPDATDRILAAVGPREVGLFIYNAGADPNGSRFLDRGVEAWLELAQRNVITTIRCCHHFAQPMRARGRGGVLLVNSGAAYSGADFITTYSGTKAFQLNFAEGLWAELKPQGVDVLTLVMISTDTPAHRTLLAERGVAPPDNLADAHEVAELGLTQIANGPVCNWGVPNDQQGYALSSADQLRKRVEAASAGARAFLGVS